jgi:hypothetical protein
MRTFSNLIIVFTQLEIYKLQSVVSCNSNWICQEILAIFFLQNLVSWKLKKLCRFLS